MQKIIYVKRSNSSFVLTDQRILESKFAVKPFLVGDSPKQYVFLWRLLLSLSLFFSALIKYVISLPGFLIIMRLSWCSSADCWASEPSSLPVARKLFHIPTLGKGAYRTKFRGGLVAYALKHASLIIANHESLIYHENHFYGDEVKKDGIKYYIPDIKTKIEVLYNGFNIDKFQRDNTIEKKNNLILTAGKTNTIADVINKGFDLFVQAAARNPQLRVCDYCH